MLGWNRSLRVRGARDFQVKDQVPWRLGRPSGLLARCGDGSALEYLVGTYSDALGTPPCSPGVCALCTVHTPASTRTRTSTSIGNTVLVPGVLTVKHAAALPCPAMHVRHAPPPLGPSNRAQVQLHSGWPWTWLPSTFPVILQPIWPQGRKQPLTADRDDLLLMTFKVLNAEPSHL